MVRAQRIRRKTRNIGNVTGLGRKNRNVFAVGRFAKRARQRRRFNARVGKQRLRVARQTRVLCPHHNTQRLTLRRPATAGVRTANVALTITL